MKMTPWIRIMLTAESKVSHVDGRVYTAYLTPMEIITLRCHSDYLFKGRDWSLATEDKANGICNSRWITFTKRG
jgi:hypothetical protein